MGELSDKRMGMVILSFLFLLLMVEMATAVPACPAGAGVVQPDGTAITVFLRGDEYAHWNESEDGYLITKDEKSKEWVYMVEQAGAAAASRHVVGKANPRAIGASRPNKVKLSAAANLSRTEKFAAEAQPAFVSQTGTMYNLVVLVSFSDLAVAYPRQSYDDLFNQVGYTADGAVGSVKDYYHQISYNALTVQSTVVESVTLDYGYAYYGANNGSGDDIRPREMVQEALAKLDARGFDFRTVDGDGDGWVDGLTIIHAGGGEEYSGNDTNYIWSHQWAMISTITYDGISMWTYHTEPARRGWDSSPSTQGITRIGVICHENGHFLGLPDLYDYGYDSEGAGNFCLMAGGSWNGSYGTTPAHMSAWCKSSLGWVLPTVPSASGVYSLGQVETNAQVYKLQGTFPSTQYFLIENRQGVGFDAGLPGSQRGVLIWHVDETQANNNDQTHYKVDLEEASGTQHLALNLNAGDDVDYFRAGNATVFTESSIPNNLSYAGQMLNVNITNVGTTGASMSVTLAFPLWSDGFEGTPHDFTPGGWTVAGTASVTTGAAYTGAYGAQIPGSVSVNSITKSLSTVGFTTIYVKYDRRLTHNGVTLVVDWSTNGTTWYVLETLTGSTSWASPNLLCASGADNNAGFRVRFRTTGGASNKYAYIDNVQITGTAIPSTTTVPNVVGQTQAAAATAITGAGLAVGMVTQAYSDTMAAGLVISQEPSGETIVLIGSAVNLTISLGPQARSISGYCLEPDVNMPVVGVLIDANNNGGGIDITDVNGYYEVAVPYNWSGTATPIKEGYTFEPNGILYNNVIANEVNDYTATLSTFIISGHITDGITPISDANVSAENGGGQWTSRYGGGSAKTDVNGCYEVVVDYNWSGAVTPTKYAYAFDEPNIIYTNVLADHNEQDYTGRLLTYIITGYTKNECNVPIEGVLVGESITDVNGFYEVWVDYAWSGMVAPSKQYYTFEPNSVSYANVLGDIADQNYVANNIYDLDCDGSIGFGDIAIISQNWLLTGEDIPGDFYKDDNDIVNFPDFADFALIWQNQ